MKSLRRKVLGTLVVLAAAAQITAPSHAAEPEFDSELQAIAQAWDHANFVTTDPAAKRAELEALSQRAASFVQHYPKRAEPLVWEGIVLSSYAGAKGGLGALGTAKHSRERLLAALAIAPEALNGSAYTSLGVLYYKVPGFPLGFGNHGKARDYLRKALELNPAGIDPNYFFGELMFEEGKFEQALQYLQRAQTAQPRANRPLADAGRQKEIAALIERTRAKLG
jgi:tetratricopeptide (TPR) repeat protein